MIANSASHSLAAPLRAGVPASLGTASPLSEVDLFMDFQPVFVLGRFIDLAAVDGEGGAQAMPVVAGADGDFEIEGHGHVLQADVAGTFCHGHAADAKSGVTADGADVADGFDLGVGDALAKDVQGDAGDQVLIGFGDACAGEQVLGGFVLVKVDEFDHGGLGEGGRFSGNRGMRREG